MSSQDYDPELDSISREDPNISSQIVARDMTLAREQIQVAADSLLRDQGYPQSLLYILRAGGLSTEQIRALPTPSFDENTGEITHDYFLIIRDYFGVDPRVLTVANVGNR